MMNRITRTRMVAVLLVLAGGVAWSKGYSGRDLSAAPSTRRTNSFLELLSGECYVPSYLDCASGTWTNTRCGQEELRRSLHDEPGATCRLPCLDISPTLAQCQSVDWLNSVCGRLEMQSFHWVGDIPDGGAHPSMCAQMLKADQGTAPALGGPVSQEVMSTPYARSSADGGVEMVTPSTGRATVRVVPYDRDDLRFAGMATTFWGYRMGQFTEFSKVHPNTDFLALVQGEKARWDGNGNIVNSCREYIYEKYYDFSLYEDATATTGSDYRAAYNVAYAPNQTAPARSAIGYWGERGEPIRQRDGTALPNQVGFPSGPQPKNTFFSTRLFKSRFTGLGTQTRADLVAAFHASPSTFPGGRPLATDIVILDDALYATLVDGQANHTHTEDWAWHHSMSDALSPVALDEELYAFDKVKDEFEGYLYRRQLVIDAIAAYWRRVVQEGLKNTPIYRDNPILDPGGLVDPPMDPLSTFLDGQRDDRNAWWTATTGTAHTFTDFTATGALNGALGSSPFGGTSPVGRVQGKLATGVAGVNRLRTQTFIPGAGRVSGPMNNAPTGLDYGVSGLASAHVPAATSQDELMTLTLMLAQADDDIENALKRARDLGCLDFGPANPCDWSPRMFFQRVQDPFSRYREPEYQRCLEKTAQDGFTVIRSPPLFQVNGTTVSVKHHGVDTVCNLPDYGVNPDSVELYVECNDRWAAQSVLALQSALAGEGTVYGHGFFGKQMGDSTQVGNDNFNISMGYAMGWRIDNLQQAVHDDHCALQPSVDGSFDLSAKALFIEQKLLHADARAELNSSGKARARLEILGESIFDAKGTFVPQSFNVIDAKGGLEATLVNASATFVVVIIPITVSGGATGRVGAGASLGGGTPEGSASGCARGNVYMTGAFKPFAHVDGFASAAVDLVIVEAGVKVTLTLVDAELPLDTELLFKLENPTDPDLTIHAKTNLDLVLTLLAGNLKAYAEICYIIDCDRYETTIFSWNGPAFRKNLFHNEFQISLGPIVAWASGL